MLHSPGRLATAVNTTTSAWSFSIRFYKLFTTHANRPWAFGIRTRALGVDSERAAYQTLHLGLDGKVVVTTGPDIRNTCLGERARPIRWIVLILLLAAWVPNLRAKDKQASQYGAGLIVNIPLPVSEVTQSVEEVVGNGIIRGTKEYNKDEYVSGAAVENSTSAFPAWSGQGKVFYKVREQALDPRNFRESGSLGTLAVRYVVLPQGENNTVLRIDALFEETFRHSVHESNGSVESSEYKEIQDNLEARAALKKQTAEVEKEKQQPEPQQTAASGSGTGKLGAPPAPEKPTESSPRTEDRAAITPPAATSAAVLAPPAADESLEQHVADLRHQVERIVKKPGAPLKSAPFLTAGTLKSLAPGTNVLVVILTPYWLGVETRDGQHGWMERDQLELLP